MAEQAKQADGGEESDIDPDGRKPEVRKGQEQEARKEQAANAGEHDRNLGRVVATDLAGQHLIYAVTERVHQDQDGAPMDDAGPRTDDDQRAGETEHDGGP